MTTGSAGAMNRSPFRSSVLSVLKVLALLAVLTIRAPVPAQAQSAAQDPALEARIEAVESKVIAWRRDIHQHPELGNREFRTSALVADHLAELGIEVQTDVAHTGVVGILEGGRSGPVVLLRADMDALPVAERVDLPFSSTITAEYNGEQVGVMHACGHDAHTAILMGVAEVLAGMRDELPGTVKFVFQPAEEGAPDGEEGGAELMVREGVLSSPDVDVAFALHLDSKLEAGDIAFRPGGMYASSDDFRIAVRGQQTHGAFPWDGVDPIVAAAHIVTSLQTIVSREINLTETAAVVSIGKIRGGVRSNIIPEEVELLGTIRALDPDVRAAVGERVREIASTIAAAHRATAEVQIPYTHGYPATINDPELTARMVPVLENAVGADHVHLRPPLMAGEDFAFIAERVPGLYIRLGGRSPDISEADAPAHHTPDFYIDEAGFVNGVRAMTAMTVSYLRSDSTGPGNHGNE